MSNRHQEASSSKWQHDRHLPPQSERHSREPSQKRPRHDDLTPRARVPHNGSDPYTSRGHAPSSTENRGKLKQDEDVASNLDSLLDEYDVDEEEHARKALEESRKRRQAIIEKHRASQTASPQPAETNDDSAQSAQSHVSVEQGHSSSIGQSQEEFSLIKRSTQRAAADNDIAGNGESERASAADFDPDADRAQELARLEQRRQLKLTNQPTNPARDAAMGETKQDEYEEIEVTDEEDDAEMDMFALSDDEESKPKAKKTKIVRRLKHNKTSKANSVGNIVALPPSDTASTSAANLSSNWDDSEGYLRTILGETLDDRYQIFAVLGKGMFASVVRARDLLSNNREVAIKIQRVQETMYRAGLKEATILRKLNASDPEDRKHIVRLERQFDYKGHLCMVFESLSMNLRDVVRRYGRDVGLNMRAVRAYAHQLFLALSHLAKQGVVHADIKPDNVLVSDTKALLKLCDLGSASYLSEMEITPYLVSRFYRAPEIILGQVYDCSIDVWSTGCTLYELATGKILFPGRTNNHMLLLMQELKGRFTTKQLRKSQFGEQHFDDANAFLSMEQDKSTGQSVVRRVMIQKPREDLRSRLMPGDAAKQLKGEELKTMNSFVDLMERCLELDPAKRIKPKDALEHPFLAHV